MVHRHIVVWKSVIVEQFSGIVYNAGLVNPPILLLQISSKKLSICYLVAPNTVFSVVHPVLVLAPLKLDMENDIVVAKQVNEPFLC